MKKEDVFLQKINKINTEGIGFRNLWEQNYKELVWGFYVKAFTQSYGDVKAVSEIFSGENNIEIAHVPARFFSEGCEDEFIGIVDFTLDDKGIDFCMWHILHPEYGVIDMQDYHKRLPEEEISIFRSIDYKPLIPNE
ncbi:hypothetical protein MOD71_18690 [Bacillus haynesii]|uniref:hypothetical protein n=1 Tax=Bacillus haynesii TaxID=1925021 RepID=UPI0022825215|nr:hypothetical protein [Bacillus haynesii]MCY8737535.1 hypothetical protein [Bacillus haynesii]